MPKPFPRTSLGRLLAGSAVVFVVCGTIALTQWIEAVEERRHAARLADLQVAALTIDAIEHSQTRTPADRARLRDAAAALDSLDDVLVHNLLAGEAAEAAAWATALRQHADAVLAGRPGPTEGNHDHAQLTRLLETAATRADAGASRAEQLAGLATAATMIATIIATALLSTVQSRVRSQRDAARAQAEGGRRLASVLDQAPDVVLVVDEHGQVTYQSASARAVFGEPGIASLDALSERAAAEARSDLTALLASPAPSDGTTSFPFIDGNGRERELEVRIAPVDGDSLPRSILVTLHDVTAETALRRELERQAYIDDLTGLPNRRALAPAIERAQREAIAESGDENRCAHALVMMDLDGFKEANDTLGHSAGDEILRIVARRLAAAVEERCTLLRLGGDELALVVPRSCAEGHLEELAITLLEAFRDPIGVADREERIRTSIGIAFAGDRVQSETLLQQADLALYAAKRAGGDTHRYFEPSMEEAANADAALSRALRDANYDGELHLLFQPVFDSETGDVEFLEALLRWDSPVLGRVTPDRFIPAAEATGEIIGIGWWVLESACAQLARWHRSGLATDLALSVNVSPRQLEADGFDEALLELLDLYGVAPQCLIVEVTESALIAEDGPTVAMLRQLRDAGCQVAIDDFGSGFSNLGQMLGLPLDIIKVDRMLLMTLSEMRQRLGGAPDQPCAIMSSIVGIAEVLGASVVAEGVEDPMQRESLRSSGVRYLQGFLLGRPGTAEEVARVVHGPAAARRGA